MSVRDTYQQAACEGFGDENMRLLSAAKSSAPMIGFINAADAAVESYRKALYGELLGRGDLDATERIEAAHERLMNDAS